MKYRSTVFFAALLAAACGDVTKLPADAANPGGEDAPSVDAATPDAMADATAAACDVTKPFAAATEVPGIHDLAANDIHGSLTADELTIYFGSNRADPASDTMHLYSSTRSARDAVFPMPTLVGGTFSTEGESNPSISPDGNTLYFDSFRVQEGVLHIFTSTRRNAAVVFPAATMIPGDFLHTPSITADGNVLYVANIQNGALARLDKVGGSFGPPQTVATGLRNSATSPVTSDDLTLFLSLGVQFGDDIHVTQRTSTRVPFPIPTPVTELKTSATQAAASWVSADGCRLYITYQPPGDKSRIYVAARPQ